MRIECVSRFGEILPGVPGVIVLPEYCEPSEVVEVARTHPGAIVVAAVQEGVRSRGLILHRNRNHVEYIKIGSDGRTRGTEVPPSRLPVYELPQICIGMLICKDVQQGTFLHQLIQRLERSRAPLKLICVPAFMGPEWFGDDPVGAPFNRVHIALCNHTTQDRPRCRSFISDASGTKLRHQIDREPIAWVSG